MRFNSTTYYYTQKQIQNKYIYIFIICSTNNLYKALASETIRMNNRTLVFFFKSYKSLNKLQPTDTI